MKHALCRSAVLAVLAALALPLFASAATPADPLAGLAYRSIGPAIGGGRATAIVGSDRDPNRYYVGGANGGVWKSVDGGISWAPTFDKEPTAAIGAIAIAPNDPDDVWVGTGEAYPRNTVEEGAGMWHSRDGGKTWKHVGLDDAGSIARISVDPRDPKTVVVGVLGHIYRDGTTRGVYLTHDGGATWKRTLYVGPGTGVSDIARMQDRPSTLFAGMWQFRRTAWSLSSGGPQGGLYRSDDGGATWSKITGHGFAPGLTGRIGVAAATHGRVYAIVQSKSGELWRSDDRGSTWKQMPHSAYLGARSFYFTRISVDPSNRDRLVNVSLILSMSTDGGRSFHAIAKNVGWDYHNPWWSRDGQRLFVASDEGLVASRDGGKHFSQPYAMPFSQAYHIGFDAGAPSYNVCIGLQDDSSWCGPASSDNGLGVLNRDWYTIGPGDGMYALFDPIDPNFIWSTSTSSDPGQVYVFNAKSKQTFDVSPSSDDDAQLLARKPHRFNWDTPLAFLKDGTALVGGESLFASTDRGMHWKVVSPDLTRNVKAHQHVSGGPIGDDVSGAENNGAILHIAISPVDEKTMWVGTDDGYVQHSTDGGTTWKNVTAPMFPIYGRVYGIEPGHADANVAYVAIDNHMVGDDAPHLYATSDGGAHWRSISANLPGDFFTRVVREDPKNPNLLYAGTRRGVFASFDRGGSWRPLRLNMPATAIYDLQIVPQTDDLLVATHGRGVWVLDDLRAVQQWTPPSALTVYAPQDAYRMYQWSPINGFTDGTLPDGDFVGKNRKFGAVVTYALPNAAKSVTLTILDSSGAAVKHISGKAVPHKAGMNRTAWDLSEDGPTTWHATFEQNKGPKSGAEVLPGTYTMRVVADGVTRETTVAVKLDPRDPSTPADLEARHAILVQINAELSGVNTMLNAIDLGLKHSDAAGRARLLAFKSRLTVDPHNIEDLKTTAQIREELLDLLGRIGSSSYQPPTGSQLDEAARLKPIYDRIAADGHTAGLF